MTPDGSRSSADGPTGSSGVTIRRAQVEDSDAVAAILAAGALSAKEDVADLASYREALDEINASSTSQVLVAEVGGEVVGLCQLILFRHLQRNGGRCAEIESMHVAEPWRGRGVGATLLEAAVAAAASYGCYRVQLTSNVARLDAHRFYERHGFEPSHVGFKRSI